MKFAIERYCVNGDSAMKTKCDYCGDVPDIGYLMPDGDLVCASHECCYEYCKATGQFWIPNQDSNQGLSDE